MDQLVRRVVDRMFSVTPLSGWTAAYALVGIVVAVIVWRSLVRSTGWRSRWTLLTLVVLAGVLALTLSPTSNYPRPLGVRSCLRGVPGELAGGPRVVLGSAEALLNLVLLAPLGFSLVLATRRLLGAVLVVVLLPAAVEITQTQVSGRMCSGADYVTNVAGGVAGVALGALVLTIARTTRRTRART